MTRQKLPNEEELQLASRLCSFAFSRRAGTKMEVTLHPFELPGTVTKSSVFGANVSTESMGGSVDIPSKVVVKHYLSLERGGKIRTSEDSDTTDLEYRTERAVLGLDVHINGGRGDIRIYPRLYSGEVPECDEQRVIIREYIPGETLEQIAEKQVNGGGIKWESGVETSPISVALAPIALLHAHTPVFASALDERRLLKFGPPREEISVPISNDRAGRFIKYLGILARGCGKELENDDKTRLREAFFELDRNYTSRPEFLGIVDGELDVFTHHILLDRLPDAGGLEIGGFVRDLAPYSAPIFLEHLWGKAKRMPETVVPAYLNLRRQIEENLIYNPIEVSEALAKLGVLFASFSGNIRKAAAVVHYNGEDKDYPAEKEVSAYLPTSLAYLDAFVDFAERGHSQRAKEIKRILSHYQLDTDNYKLASLDRATSNERRDFIGAVASGLVVLFGGGSGGRKK